MKKDLRKNVLERIGLYLEEKIIQEMKKEARQYASPCECKIEKRKIKTVIPDECKLVLARKGFRIDDAFITVDPDNQKSLVYKELNEEIKRNEKKVIKECKLLIKEIEETSGKIKVERVDYNKPYLFSIETEALTENEFYISEVDKKIACEFFKEYNLDFVIRCGTKWFFSVN